jgi:chemotaxis protein histidine kinase CheA/ActR/RegA family two-component response regulator
MSNTFDKVSVLDSFIEEVNSYLPEIESNLGRLAQSHDDMDALEETHRRTHTIGGSASMMDFPGLAHVAHGMEDILDDAIDGLITLDELSLGLLQRSLGRLHQLLEGIHNGVDEEAVIAEDDADYARYRSQVDAAPLASPPMDEAYYTLNEQTQKTPAVSEPAPSFSPPAQSPSMPSFDEVLASFHTATPSDDDVVWPEETALSSYFEEKQVTSNPLMQQTEIPQTDQPITAFSSDAYQRVEPDSQDHLSALDALMASTQHASPELESSFASWYSPFPQTPPAQEPAIDELYNLPPSSLDASIDMPLEPIETSSSFPLPQPVDSQLPAVTSDSDTFPQLYEDVQQQMQSLEPPLSVLNESIAQLHSAMKVIETQRSEYKGFLNGSKDALDRMEEWAGKAMGLNLRNSPEQVRRYLPLSVMWVSNSKLKKVFEVLNKTTGNFEQVDQQFQDALQQLQTSLQNISYAFQQQTATNSVQQDVNWSPWNVQVSRDEDRFHERVTFERQGDPAQLRAEIEAQLRSELNQEYEARQQESQASTLTQRAELEQQIRKEIRQEFEDRERLKEQAFGSGAEDPEALQQLETRLRSDIEIQVRQEFLAQLFSQNEQKSEKSSEESSGTSKHATTLASDAFPVAAPMTPIPSMPSSLSSPGLASSNTDFGEEAAEVFRAEADEHLQTISMYVEALEKDPQNLEYIQGIRRAVHTLKGAAGMMGFRAIADLSHISEDMLDLIMDGTISLSSTTVSLILDTTEALDLLITGNDQSSVEAKVHSLHTRYVELLHAYNATIHLPEDYIDAEEEDHDLAAPAVASVIADDATSKESISSRSSYGNLSVRVHLQKLDELVNLFGEMLVSRSILDERLQRLTRLVSDVAVSSNRLSDVGQKLDSRFEAATLPSGRSIQVMPGEGDRSLVPASEVGKNSGTFSTALVPANQANNSAEHLPEFDELELDRYTEFHQLARGLNEGISDMATLSTEMDTIIHECESVFSRENRLSATFQDRLMKTRLVPLSTMAPRLYRAARAVALKQGKEIEFLQEGETTEVDRTVYEEISGPLLHLVRNAVNHAIEKPEVRRQRKKPVVGQIKLSASYEGNQIVISVQDDGNGLDREHIRQTAITRGLIQPDQQISEDEVVSLIFQPGFSTAEVLSEESGRGVGLDVVRDSVSRLRGTLVVESTPGQGTTFTMTFPISLAIQSTMMVIVAGQQFAIPTANVESIGRIDTLQRTSVNGQPAVLIRDNPYPLQLLAQYLSLPNNGILDDKAQLLLVNSAGHRVALIVDEIRGKSDIVMKSLGPHLRDVHGIAGGTVLGNGRVVLVLELSSLLSSSNQMYITSSPRDTVSVPVKQRVDVNASRQNAPSRPASTPAAAEEKSKYILVVDDSPSVRRVVSNMLKQHSWTVQMARDGVEALEMISAETPTAVLLDIEMPRMDGYELISTVRAQEQYRTLPLIVLTSRAASKHQQRAMTLGASAYVVKPYQDEELLNTINSLVYDTTPR